MAAPKRLRLFCHDTPGVLPCPTSIILNATVLPHGPLDSVINHSVSKVL